MGDRPVNETDNSVPGNLGAPDDNDKAEYLDGRLRELSENFRPGG